jgi:hypothetical protein
MAPVVVDLTRSGVVFGLQCRPVTVGAVGAIGALTSTWRCDMTTTVRRKTRVAVVAGVLATIVAGVGIGSSVEAGSGVKVEGVQVPLDPNNGVYEMTGDLVGVWITTDFVLGVETPSGVVTGTGTELFIGCYDADGNATCGGEDPTGEITFSFQYSGRFDTASGALMHGRCHHPVTGGTGDFAEVSGELGFHDDPSGCSFYKGHLNW